MLVARVNYFSHPELLPCKGKLERIDIRINNKTVKALVDSGTEITVVRKSIVGEGESSNLPDIFLQGIFGPPVKCPLRQIELALDKAGEGVTIPMEVICATAENLEEEILLPPRILNALSENLQVNTTGTQIDRQADDHSEEQSGENNDQWAVELIQEKPEVQGEATPSEIFLRSQELCEPLKESWKMGKEEKGNYVDKNEFLYHRDVDKNKFLYHRDKVLGENMLKLVLPKEKREEIMQIVNIDLIGPIDPASEIGRKYILWLVDQHTRWAETFPLGSLNAKSTYEAFLNLFTRTGITDVIASDEGTNFNAKVTVEFGKRLGVTPKFSTPLYPQANGLVERFNRTLKPTLHHIIRQEGRNGREQAINVIFEGEDTFGKIPSAPIVSKAKPFEYLLSRIQPPGLNDKQKGCLQVGLKEGTQISRRKLQDARAGFHRMELFPNVVRLKPRCYGIPVVFRQGVKGQIQNLLCVDDFEQHPGQVEKVFETLIEFDFSAGLGKYNFAARQIRDLGHKIGGGGERKIRACKNLCLHTIMKHVRAILGWTGLYKAYIPNFAKMSVSITGLTHKNAPNKVIRGEIEIETFENLKGITVCPQAKMSAKNL
jgi:hypothetical protein